MNSAPLIYADFQNADAQGHVRLNCMGTVKDLSREQVQLTEGLPLFLYSEDMNDQGEEDRLMVEGTATYSQAEQCWVAVIDWDKIRHESEIKSSGAESPDVPLAATLTGGNSKTRGVVRPTTR